jgi:thiol:disulfide interchange protein DsbD
MPVHARARLVSEMEALTPGKTAWIGVTFDIDPEWHLYWNGLSDAGFPVTLTFTAPEGYKVGPLQWPAPKRQIAPGDLLDYIYEDRVTLLAPLEVPASAKPGSKATIAVEGTWLVCKTACVPGGASLSVDLPVAAAGSDPKPSRDAPLFTKARERIPKPLPAQGSGVTLRWSGEDLAITVPAAKALAFYAGIDCGKLSDLVHTGEVKGDTLTLKNDGPAGKARVQGVLEISPAPGKSPTLYELDLKPAGANPGAGSSSNK